LITRVTARAGVLVIEMTKAHMMTDTEMTKAHMMTDIEMTKAHMMADTA